MVLQYDNYNLYNCAPGSSLRYKSGSTGLVGPAVNAFECVSTSGQTSKPGVWNPVYDAGKPVPPNSVAASQALPAAGTAAGTGSGAAAASAPLLTGLYNQQPTVCVPANNADHGCAWVWWLLGALIAALIVLFLIIALNPRKDANETYEQMCGARNNCNPCGTQSYDASWYEPKKTKWDDKTCAYKTTWAKRSCSQGRSCPTRWSEWMQN